MRDEKTNIITGGLTLIVLGALLLLSNLEIYAISKSWPILIIVIGLLAVLRKVKELSGWLISSAGIIFLINQNDWVNLNNISAYFLPLLVVVLGIIVISRKRRGR